MRSPTKAVPKGGRLNLFLVEMIIVLLFFSIASAVILKAFVAADRLSAENMRLERMAFCAQSAAEVFSATADLSETAERLFGVGAEDASEISVPLDGECRYSPADAELYMKMKITENAFDGKYLAMSISFSNTDGEELYRIEAAACDTGRTVDFYE